MTNRINILCDLITAAYDWQFETDESIAADNKHVDYDEELSDQTMKE